MCGLTTRKENKTKQIFFQPCRPLDSSGRKMKIFSEDDTCVLGNLALGNHLLAFRIHHFTVLVLFQTLQHIFWVCFWTKPLQKKNPKHTQVSSLGTWKRVQLYSRKRITTCPAPRYTHTHSPGTTPPIKKEQHYSLNWLQAQKSLLRVSTTLYSLDWLLGSILCWQYQNQFAFIFYS